MNENTEPQCVICEANFRTEGMVGNKCIPCNTLYPDAETREDALVKNPNKVEILTENTVRKMIYQVLEEAGIKRKKCESCNKLFFSKSPATKFCSVCRPKEIKENK